MSKLIEVRRDWGQYTDLYRSARTVQRVLKFFPGGRTSLHMHYLRAELLVVAEGEGALLLGGQLYALQTGALASVPIGVSHQLVAGPTGMIVCETQFGPKCDETDIVRYS